jgi:hypothetical protein
MGRGKKLGQDVELGSNVSNVLNVLNASKHKKAKALKRRLSLKLRFRET